MWHQDKEPYLLRYYNSPSHKNIQRQMPQWPASEAVQMKESSHTADTKSLPPIFTERADQDRLPVPELTFAPLVQSVETVAPMIMREMTEIEQTETETMTPDIDDIARQVYPILKRRLARERERALGIS